MKLVVKYLLIEISQKSSYSMQVGNIELFISLALLLVFLLISYAVASSYIMLFLLNVQEPTCSYKYVHHETSLD